MNLSPTDKDKLQAYLDALDAVPLPRVTDARLTDIALQVVVAVERAITQAEERLQ